MGSDCTLVAAAVSVVPSVDLLVCYLLEIWGVEGWVSVPPRPHTFTVLGGGVCGTALGGFRLPSQAFSFFL